MELRRKHPYIMFLIGDVFMNCIDTESGSWAQLPCEGGILDQPYIMMQELGLIRLNWQIHRQKCQEKQMEQMKMKRGRR